MSFANPTSVRPGLTGTFEGRRYRVAGRVVLGTRQDRETYYWNEFHLVALDGEEATLAHEVTDEGVAWRLFRAFVPSRPMTAAEAASVKVGDAVDLEGRPLRVTWVDESVVHHIEGTPPEGVEVGDVARYFNADGGKGMVVVSWTGGEVEFFRGSDLPRGAVARAFGLSREGTEASSGLTGSGMASAVSRGIGAALFLLLGVAGLWGFLSCRNGGPAGAARGVTLTKAAAPPLSVGVEGRLGGVAWRVTGHALVEVAGVGRRHERHEYELRDSEGGRALLVFPAKPGGQDVLHLLAFPLEPAWTGLDAATNRVGDQVDFGGTQARVTSLSRVKVVRAEGWTQGGDAPRYGFTAEAGATVFWVRWNDTGIQGYRGQASSAAGVIQAFQPLGSP